MQTSQTFMYVDPAIQHWEFVLGNQSQIQTKRELQRCVLQGQLTWVKNQEQRMQVYESSESVI